MSKNKLRNLLSIYAMTTSFSNQGSIYEDSLNPTIRLTKEKPVPKGAKQYFFNENGEFSTEHMLKGECVFKCLSISDSRAIKKFKKWKKSI